ncbi:DUF6049 family protein [Bifidobacterium sp. ESL0800]|uniref:DUF6049 family protein n=1 Tax=Bifidobacterium sp. ESL0800 TaxID=2983236 RepID=UPI0023F64990|nr:DUF6049 family protein [Bifidobacterium sp. ESL0800]WEV75364.1 DUF6049 family protein [Bifidobacterium sp. ESL0800]
MDSKQSPLSSKISAIVSSVIALLCASALVLSPGVAMAAETSETDASSDTSTTNPGGSGSSTTPANPSTPGDNTGKEPAKPATPSQPTQTPEDGTSEEQTPGLQTSPSTRSFNNFSPSSRQTLQGTAGNADQNGSASNEPGAKGTQKDAEVTITASTPVVTANSGYHLSAVIKNTSDSALPAGTLSVAVNDYYTFVSRSDLQQWAQGDSRIQVPNQIGQVNVPEIAKGEKTSVTIDANPDQQSLKNMLSWGPKPVRVDYSFVRNSSDEGKSASKSQKPYLNTTHTFLTRSGDGLNTANTPPMDITIAMPLTSNGWQIDGQKLTEFMTAGVGDSAKILSTHKLSQPVEQLISKHPGLQVITDPTLAQSLPVPPKTSGIMQSGDFDITAYSALNNGSEYEKAGIASKDWNAETGLKQYRDATGDTKANMPSYAWPGHGRWTMGSLQTARAQGYSTAIATDVTGVEDADDNSTIHTGKYIIHTSAGDITVLTAQDELSRLAQGLPTDKTVDGESSAAGRLARFMAQSAFYQMESPYAARNLLICFDTGTANSENNAQNADTLMQAVEQAPWLKLRSMSELNQTEAYLSGEKAASAVPDSANIHASVLEKIRQSLSTLAASKNDIDRFTNSILDESSSKTSENSGNSGNSEKSKTPNDKSSPSKADLNSSSAASSGSASNSGSASGSNATSGSSADETSGQSGTSSSKNGKSDKSSNTNKSENSSPSSSSNANSNSTNGGATNNGNVKGNANAGNTKVDTGDAQSLARQDADATAKRSKNGCDWMAAISSLQNAIALHALSCNDTVAKRMDASAQNLAGQLMDGIKITPSESITVLSESAKMPVTVSNNHPYPVTVKISSLSNSMEIVTTRFATLSIPARSEAQTTFNVRVSTSGTATAHLTLTDRRGDAFSTPESTRITSTLRLSDMSGMIFIVIALFLGVLGLWRQFNRKKDPDE